MKPRQERDEFWEPLRRTAPSSLPRDFAQITSAKARLVDRVWRLLRLSGCLAIVLAAIIGWSLSRKYGRETPPDLSLFYAETSTFVALQP